MKIFKKENRIYLALLLIYLISTISLDFYLISKDIILSAVVIPILYAFLMLRLANNIRDSRESMKKLEDEFKDTYK